MFVEDTMLGKDEFISHAKQIAKRQVLSKGHTAVAFPAIPGINDCFEGIKETYDLYLKEYGSNKRTVPAAEWLIDNYYALKSQISEVKIFFNKKAVKRLPVIESEMHDNGVFLGPLPRIYTLALEIVSHTDGVVDEVNIFDFINAYQEINYLKIDEIWHLGIMIKIALIEKIYGITTKLVHIHEERRLAGQYADGLIRIKEKDDKDIEKYLEKCFVKIEPERMTLIEHFSHRIKAYKNLNAISHNFFDEKLSQIESDHDRLIRHEHEMQTSLKVSMGNSITSLRNLDSIDAVELFERLCRVEQILKEDPAGCYDNMDLDSREYYRKQVIKIAREHNSTELNVAKVAKKLALAHKDDGQRKQHVGYYLAGSGIDELIGNLKGEEWIGKNKSQNSIKPYLAVILSLAFILLFFLALSVSLNGGGVVGVILVILAVVPVLSLSHEIVRKLFLKLVPPATLPRLSFKEGIPDEAATMIIIPTLLTSVKGVVELFEHLEVIYKGNSGKNIYFAIVGDLKDAENQSYPKDRQIASKGLEMAAKLNSKYTGDTGRSSNMVNLHGYRNNDTPIFYFFLRKRAYSEAEDRWMGWERKRGAIIEFNNLILKKGETTFNIKSTPAEFLPQINYVITLDSDTKLNIGDAAKLIGIAAHPLNKPVVNYDKRIVEEGYGIFQPRVSADLESANVSLFSKIFAGQAGIETYSIKVSDIYMDLCKEGIYTGKGIYDPYVFNELLEDAIPDNLVLSHDLLEGSYLRCGFVNDVNCSDNYPSKFNSYAMRMHRWIRGDWQISGWLFGRVKNRKGDKVNNPINSVSKWKIFDNLRRSAVDLCLYVLIMVGALFFNGNKLAWLLGALVISFAPLWLQMLESFFSFKEDRPRRHKSFSLVISGNIGLFLQRLCNLAFLPYNAKLMFSAIATTLYRMFISKTKMLEWVTAADVDKSVKDDKKSYLKSMRICTVSGVILIIVGALGLPAGKVGFFIADLLVGVLWVAAPFLAYHISKPYTKQEEKYTGTADPADLRLLSSKIWAFYEDFTGLVDNFLPPDNVQFEPIYVVAHRTSPTNIGFYLMSAVGACDMGYITRKNLYEIISDTFSTMNKIETWKGHLFNWYNTVTLKPLNPMYVSTVDSGNLAGYMMVVSVALDEIAENRPNIDAYMDGIKDIFYVLGGKIPFDKNSKVKLNDLCEKHIKEINDGSYKDDVNAYLENLNCVLQSEESRDALVYNDETSRWYTKLINFINEILDELNLTRVDNEMLAKNIKELSRKFIKFAEAMDFEALYDKRRELFSIGYNFEDGRITNSHYDLLVSEARQASFLAIACGEVPVKHWFKLGRRIITYNNYVGLASWSGTAFEFLMPELIMKSYDTSLLNETVRTSVLAQKQYIKAKTRPWGISESGFYDFDLNLNYQYKAFGVPNLGFKRGLGNEKVIAPYASILALAVDPPAVLDNLLLLTEEKANGDYGYYEAIDYTPARLFSEKKLIVKSYMAHHQGMSFISILNYLNNNIMKERFHSLPQIKCAEFLLKEKVPLFAVTNNDAVSREVMQHDTDNTKRLKPFERDVGEIRNIVPKTLVLSNSNYYVFLTNSGYGYSKINESNISRWSCDGVRGDGGLYVYLKNMSTNSQWSNTFAPAGQRPEKYDVYFSGDKASFTRWDGDIETTTLITVSPEDDVEIRRLKIVNHGSDNVELEVTSYMELAMSPNEDYMSHPAFNNLFIRTEFLKEQEALLASKRSRKTSKDDLWVVSKIAVGENPNNEFSASEMEFDTDTMIFPGRNNDSNGLSCDLSKPLKGSVGAVLNASMTMRRRLNINAGGTANLYVIVGASKTKEIALKLINKYDDTRNAKRAFDLSYTRSIIEAEYLDISEEQEDLYNDMMAQIIFLSPSRRKYKDLIEKSTLGKNSLWSFGISGDIPLVTAYVKSVDDEDFLEMLVDAHKFLRVKGILCDFIFIVNDEAAYLQPIRDLVNRVIMSNNLSAFINNKGGFYIISQYTLSKDQSNMFVNASRIILHSDGPEISEQLKYKADIIYTDMSDPYLNTNNSIALKNTEAPPVLPEGRLFDNGTGYFNPEGNEYVIYKQTPAPWVNVVSNGVFGFTVSESGAGYVWNANSSENRLTTWSNNPVTDPINEIIYMLDLDTGQFRSLTPKPCGKGHFIIKHGFGYSTFESEYDGIKTKLTLYITNENSVKVSFVEITNTKNQPLNLRLFYYVEPVIGVMTHKTMQYLVTEPGDRGFTVDDNDTNIFLVKNSFTNIEQTGSIYDYGSPDSTAFIATSGAGSYTGDRLAFVGINGNLSNPSALIDGELDNRSGGGLLPCCAITTDVTIKPASSESKVFLIGEVSNKEKVYETIAPLLTPEKALVELDEWKNVWNTIINKLKIKTPDESMNLILNGWVLYQTIACRVMARTAFYQSGGAFGFRDQLQDAMALIYSLPELTRKQILAHCRHQFVEGDVQHWWHEPEGKGIRTRYSDDRLWLPYVVSEYIEKTGDLSILNEVEPYLKSPALSDNEDERYESPIVSDEKGTVYDHCIRAIDISLNYGERGLSLIGGGDWNDGMNKVGHKGKGESVWLSWFLMDCLRRMVPYCEEMGDTIKAGRYQFEIKRLLNAIFENAWDGRWFLRAFFDDGSKLGTSNSSECAIDSISQTWSVITISNAILNNLIDDSENFDEKYSKIIEAMHSVDVHLVDREHGIVKLLSPPFDSGPLNPGYIKSYVPGVRENGGQYTHAAIWYIIALSRIGYINKDWLKNKNQKENLAQVNDAISQALDIFHMINPINHSRTPIETAKYKIEPYVVAADVYDVGNNAGRGGWSWYTGSSGWLYRAAVEEIIGFQIYNGEKLRIRKTLPKGWNECLVEYTNMTPEKNSIHKVKILRADDGPFLEVDGERLKQDSTGVEELYFEIPLFTDGKSHDIVCGISNLI